MRQRVDTDLLLDRLIELGHRHRRAAPPRSTDVVHFDLNPANIIHEGGRLRAVIDWNVPFTGASQGDRGFDVATLLFYTYDLPDTRAGLWKQASSISGRSWTIVYLCHLVLRQVEWTLRHAPHSDEENRFLNIASAVLDDCGRLP